MVAAVTTVMPAAAAATGDPFVEDLFVRYH